MSEISIEFQIYFDDADKAAFFRDIEAIYLKYGEEPAPHLKKARDTALKNAAASLGLCAQYRQVPLGHS